MIIQSYWRLKRNRLNETLVISDRNCQICDRLTFVSVGAGRTYVHPATHQPQLIPASPPTLKYPQERLVDLFLTTVHEITSY